MLECTHTKKDKEVDLEVDEEMDEDVDENVGEELDDVYFQTCEARVCQSVHTEGRDPRLQLLVVVCVSCTGFLQTILSCSATHARSMYTFSNV